MKKLLLLLLFPVLLFPQSNYNLNLVGDFDWSGYSYDSEGSDIWGWVNPNTGNEYALVGLNTGFSVVDISNPQNPSESFFISGANTMWRDIKTWGNYAYVINEGSNGLLIVDLTDLSGQTYVNFTDYFNTAHNIYIDENGVAYVFGTNVGSGGVMFFDVNTNPMNPTYLGSWDNYYIHDGMARGDTLWVGCIYEGEFFCLDVSNKSNPIVLGSHVTPNLFSHNIWVSDNGDYVFTTDEQSDSYIGSYDVQDMSNIQEVDRIQSNPGSNSIPHNTHVDGNFLVTSWYRDGTVVHDATFPNNLIEVAFYDSYTGSGNGFDGCWGTYPYLPSGLVISSDINSATNGNGRLLVLERQFTQASYLQGNVVDSITLLPLPGVNVEILNTFLSNSNITNLYGDYNSGTADPNLYDVVFTLSGYYSDTVSVNLSSGVITTVDVELVPILPTWNCDSQGNCYDPANGTGEFTSLSNCQSVCVPAVLGCTNPSAINFDPNANTTVAFGGALDNTFGSGGYFTGNQHLNFDASKECIIRSAMVYAQTAETITFELRNSGGTVLDDTTLSIPAGQQTIDLNLEVPIGSDFQLGIAAANSNLYRNNAGANYPYNIASAINITSSSATSSPYGYYYFYYNIEVEIPCQSVSVPSWDCDGQGNCSDPGTGNGQYISLSQCQSSCVVPSWDCDNQGNCYDPGNGTGQYSSLSSCQSSCIVPSWDCDNQGNCYDPGNGTGQYSSLVSCQSSCIVPSWDCDNQGNCYDPGNGQGVYSSISDCEVECVNVSVYDNGITQLKLFPNPFKGLINIQFINTQKCNLELKIFNSIGESIYKESTINHSGEYRTSINLERYPKSIYFIQIQTDNGVVYKKIISQ